MASFMSDLWESIFTPGPTPTLLLATNGTFAALQLLLFVLLLATSSVHFVVLSVLCAGLWYSINWFAREIQAQKAKDDEAAAAAAAKAPAAGQVKKEKSPEPGSETETETEPPVPLPRKAAPAQARDKGPEATGLLKPNAEELRRRRSLGDSSGYVSTDSEWEKVSEGEEKR